MWFKIISRGPVAALEKLEPMAMSVFRESSIRGSTVQLLGGCG